MVCTSSLHCSVTKFKIVLDSSTKINGVPFNNHLLQGPDLTNNLIGVFIRFRQETVAVFVDIKNMFFQVLVSYLVQCSFQTNGMTL